MEKIEKIEKDGRIKNGGKRKNSGRKPHIDKEKLVDVRAMIESHALVKEEVKSPITTELVKKTRLLIILDGLFAKGRTGDVPASKEYLDRILGKSPISLKDAKGKPLLISSDES